MKKRNGNLKALMVAVSGVALLIVFAIPGCGSQGKAEVERVLEEAGEPEPGTSASWLEDPTPEEEEAICDNPNGQWAMHATASSELGGTITRPGWAALEAVGEPDVPAKGVDGRAWSPRSENAGYEWIELTYWRPVHATGIRIREIHASGTVVMVELKDLDGDYRVKWKGTDKKSDYLIWLILDFPRTEYLTDVVRVTLDTTLETNYKEIDAVQLVGSSD